MKCLPARFKLSPDIRSQLDTVCQSYACIAQLKVRRVLYLANIKRCRYLVGVVDKASGKMTVHDAKLFTMLPHRGRWLIFTDFMFLSLRVF